MPFEVTLSDNTSAVGKIRAITESYIEVVMCEPAAYCGSTIKEYYPTKFLSLQEQINVAVSALYKLYLMAKDSWVSTEAYTIVNKEKHIENITKK